MTISLILINHGFGPINIFFPFPYSHQTSTLRIQDKYPLEPPEVPPRDYTTDEDHHLDNGEN